MKRLLFTALLFVAFYLPSTLWAADPIIGTWKLNIEKSNQQQYKELTNIYKEIGSDMMECTLVRVKNDGTAVNKKLKYPAQGGIAEGPGEMEIKFELFINPGEWYGITSSNGKQIMYIHKVVSKDGKTMYNTAKRIDPMGNTDELKFVFDKQ